MKRILISVWMVLLAITVGYTQELNAKITINTPKLQTVDPQVFESLKSSLQEFFNNTKWTNDVYETQERINVSINMTITAEVSPTEFQAEMAIQASRPVYNSEYETVLLNHVDKDIAFAYEQYQPVQYTQNSFSDNLTSVMAFYAHIILGLDYDSYTPFGGESYLLTAQEILNNIPAAVANRYKGWRSVESIRNRYWMIENLLTPRVQPMRQAYYDYHRLGLDKMADEPKVGRAIMLQAIEAIYSVDKNYPNSMIVQMFSNAKAQEIIDVFAGATREEKQKVVKLMSEIDPANASRYRILL